MNEPSRNDWISAIKGINPKTTKLQLKSPLFEYGNWRIAAEHLRNFRSVVIQWIGAKANTPVLPDDWYSSPSDARKGWTHRVRLSPADLPEFLDKLSQFEKGKVVQTAEIFPSLQKSNSGRNMESESNLESSYQNTKRISEREMEEAISSNPKKFLKEDGLKLISRQYRIGNYIFDLLFEDRHGAKLIVEIQKGTLDRNHTYKILDYYDEYKVKNPQQFIELMIIANEIPRERRDRLRTMGIEFREIPINFFFTD